MTERQTAEKDHTRWACNACPWVHAAHPVYGWSKRDDRAVEVHQTMLCPDAVTADGHACIGDACAACAAALARVIPPAKGDL